MNRASVYDKVFTEKSGSFEEKMQTVIFEFAQILQLDSSSDEYIEYDQNAPLVIDGIQNSFARETEINAYYSSFPALYNSILKKVENEMQ